MTHPPKKILLVGSDEEQVGLLSYLLRTWGYHTFTASSAATAARSLLLMPAETPVDLLVVLWPLDDAEELLRGFKRGHPDIPTLALAICEQSVKFDSTVDSALCRGQCSSAEILERIKVLTARKRGPEPGSHHATT